MLRVYNTLTRKKEEFQTLEPGLVKMYVCGVTVYSDAHIGHAMFALVFDIVRRYLTYRGYEVRQVINYTDVDDKIINRANALGVDASELAEKYIQEFRRQIEVLNILPATVNPRATQEMPQIIRMIEGLIEKGFAYPAKNGDVYFRVTKDPDYGKLSGRRIEDMQAGARIEVGEEKEHPMDFAVWKASKPGEPAWDSPWGKGRPGWHIECSAMNLSHLGEQIDIHGGGNDLVFPHHENEIAQTECFTGKPFARFWMHNGMLQLQGEKMSKSLGNLVTIDDFLSRHEADDLRMMVLNGSYRAPLSYSDDIVDAAERGLDRLRSALKPAPAGASGASAEMRAALDKQTETTQQTFIEAMDDDFNSSGGLAALFELVRTVNTARDAGATDAELKPAQDTLVALTGVLGLRLSEKKASGGDADKFIALLVEVRAEMRTQKLWAMSDLIRDRLKELGVAIEDNKDGTTWHW
ncbi:MAG: cysteine--tRNA ligase [Candidatus Atribacteria bacterium]|nr:cysteine--tRNA ligase [Candidatus Atribacteria bacterium]